MTPIDKARWLALSPLLDDLLDADSVSRQQKLQALAAVDPEAATDLAKMLADHDALGQAGFLDRGVLDAENDAGLAGQVVDRYTLDRQLGEGGMGSVWLAHRSDGRYEGQVAIKFLRLPSMGPAGLQRFEREGQVLARLKHPNIAHLLDAGVTGNGQPYLVLEYVHGEPIDEWCKARSPDITARTGIFLQVLAAVMHAHGKLILHRDIKPSNILVTAEGQAKLLDFGIAKLLDDAGSPAQPTEMTQLAGRAFTLDYASPEQIQGGEVTTATDVYSLGVLLYVLLTGQHPTAGGSVTPAERLRALVDTEPRRLSAVVARTQPREQGDAATAEHIRALRGDLDNIVAKALKKTPAERYQTVDAFAQDLRRYLNNEPVSARADSLAYRMRKFIVRNALPVSAAAIVLLAIVVAAVVSLWQARVVREQRDRALVLSARNAAVIDFFSSMLTEVAPNDQPVHVSELLERSERLLLGTDTDPEHQIAVLALLAEYYLSAGNATKARPLLDRALELSVRSDDAALKATVICNNAYAISLQNQRDAALQMMERGIEMSRVDPLAAMRCLQRRAFIAQNFNDPAGALEYSLAAQASFREARVRKPDQEAGLLADLAYAHYLSGHTAEADRYYQAALDRYTQMGRAESPSTFTLRNNWGIASYAAGDNRRALENYDEALRIAKQRDPKADPPVYLLTNRALALASLARYPEALQAFDVAIETSVRTNNVAAQLNGLANRAGTYLIMGDVDRAARELDALDRKYGSMIPPDSVPGVTIRFLKGRMAAARGDLPRALAELTATIDFFDQRGMAVAPVARALNVRASVHLQQGDMAAARADAQRALDLSRRLQGAKPRSSLTGQSLLQLAEVESAARATEASRTAARDAFEHLTATLGATHPDAVRAKVLAL